jgi:hypothetical protein
MTEGDPKTLEEALELREQYENGGRIKAEREMRELIVKRWPQSDAAKEMREDVDAADAEWQTSKRINDLLSSPLPTHPGAAQKAVATKRTDQGHGICRRRGCARPAAESGGECKEHAAGTKMVETKRRKGLID